MLNTIINCLLVEDSDADALLFERALHQHADLSVRVTRAATLAAACHALTTSVMDVVVLDLNLPDSYGLATFAAVKKTGGSIPVVILTGTGDMQFALEAIAAGASDFVNKDTMNGNMARAIGFSVARKAARDSANESMVRWMRGVFGQLEERIRRGEPDGE